MKIYIRKITLIALICTLIVILPVFSSCSESSLESEAKGEEAQELIECDDGVGNNGDKPPSSTKLKCEVTYLDVGEGDCIFISLPDGKCAVIDSGNKSETLAENITDYIKSRSHAKIDYLFLTHPDIDHAGNFNYLIDNFEIGEAYLPKVHLENIFPLLVSIKESLTQNQVPIKYNEKYLSITGDGYAFCFLSPENILDTNGVYNGLDPFNPEDNRINDISAVIYFECLGSRFLFTGDAGTKVESRIIKGYENNLFEHAFNGQAIPEQKRVKVNLENIDFLKVSHHGAGDASSKEFLELIKPKHAIFSVGGSNMYGHPDSATLENFNSLLPDCKLWRTDTLGHIAIRIYADKNYRIFTQK